MFNFFRRSKKESETKRSKDATKDNHVSPVLETRNMCKNNLTQGDSVATKLLPTGLECLENSTNATTSEVATVNEHQHPTSDPINPPINDFEMIKNGDISNNKGVPIIPSPPLVSYANIVRKPENRAGVKPCGHGTTAITPSIPLSVTKRENSITPPGSPNFEIHNKVKKQQGLLERQHSVDCDKKTVRNCGNLLQSNSTGALVESVTTVSLTNGIDIDKQKNLINQEAKFQSQLNDLSKQLSIRDAEANKLRFQMEELQRDVFVKSAGMDRLEAELQAAHKESEGVRQKIKHLENDLIEFRHKNIQLENELSKKTDNYQKYEVETNAKIAELEQTIKNLQIKIENLENELETLKQEKERLEKQESILLAERDEEKRKVAEILEQAQQQKQEIEKKWKEDFEKLRTINIVKEQQLLDDFEWKLREVQQSCKKRLEDKDRAIEQRLQEAYKEAELKMKEAEEMMAQVDATKSYELEIEKLKDLTMDQEKALKELVEQQEQMKLAEESLKNEAKRLRNLIQVEKENLQHMQLKHHQEIVDKERVLKQTLHQKRTEIAMYWEERLLQECGRLKNELEQIHNEEKHFAMETVRREKDEEISKYRQEWEKKLNDTLKEIEALKKALKEKDEYYREEMIQTQTNKDRDILELRRLMDKIDMMHHDRFEKLVQQHDEELERINAETEQRIKEIEESWQSQVASLKTTLESVREQMEQESQQKIESLIAQHRSELDAQWENLIRQKSDAVQLVEDEYISKYKQLEEQFYTQQKSHESREIELLKTIDSLKNELQSKDSAIDDLQNNVDTLEGGIQVLNQEIAQQNDQLTKIKRETDQKIRGLQETINKQHEQQENEREATRLKLLSVHKQNQETIDYLQKKCQCLTKLFEEVRQRYERRESRQEDLTIISDLKQVIAEQEKDLACLNEEKRYFQMRLMSLENRLKGDDTESNHNSEEDNFEDAEQLSRTKCDNEQANYPQSSIVYPVFPGTSANVGTALSIPPTIPECDE